MTDLVDMLTSPRNERDRTIIRTSIIGIIINFILAGFKAAVGAVTNSVAVTMDAVNNLTDALSSFITIVGAKLAGKKPDKKHPLGYGRVEYLTALIISGIILYAGITAMIESVDRIINPQEVSYDYITLLILGVAVVVKIILGRYVKGVGKRVNSGPLIASGTDALMDAILSFSVFMSAVIFMVWGLAIEAYVGALIGLMIIRTAVEMIWETLNDILGKRTEADLMDNIRATICDRENVNGAYDLILHCYGPEKTIGSVHIEVPDDLCMEELDRLEREITRDVYQKHDVVMAAVGIYTFNTKDEEAVRIRREIEDIVLSHEGVVQMHGFHIYREDMLMVFDLIIDFSVAEREELYSHICSDVCARFPEYRVHVTLDADI